MGDAFGPRSTRRFAPHRATAVQKRAIYPSALCRFSAETPLARTRLYVNQPLNGCYGCLGPSGNDRYRKRSLRSQTVGGFASQLPGRGGSFAMNRPPADVFGQALLEDPPQWAELHVVANRPRVPRVSWLGSWALGTSDRGGQDKSRKVRSVGSVRNSAKSRLLANIANVSCNLRFSTTRYWRSSFDTLRRD